MYYDPTGHVYTQWDDEHLSKYEKRAILLAESDLIYAKDQLSGLEVGSMSYAHWSARSSELKDFQESIRIRYRKTNEYGTDEGYTVTVTPNGQIDRDADKKLSQKEIISIAKDDYVYAYNKEQLEEYTGRQIIIDSSFRITFNKVYSSMTDDISDLPKQIIHFREGYDVEKHEMTTFTDIYELRNTPLIYGMDNPDQYSYVVVETNEPHQMGIIPPIGTGFGKMKFPKLTNAKRNLNYQWKILKAQSTNVSQNGLKGDLAEELADVIMRKAGYIKLPSKVGSNNGFDGVFVRYGPNQTIEDIIINESKFGSAQLGTTVDNFKQMSPEWINMNIRKMLNSTDPAVKNTGKLLKNNLDIIRTKMNRLTPDGANKWSSDPGGWGQ